MQVTKNPQAFEDGETTPDENGVVPGQTVIKDVDFRMSSMRSRDNIGAKISRMVVNNRGVMKFDFYVRVLKETDH